jgi:hypothetical protein
MIAPRAVPRGGWIAAAIVLAAALAWVSARLFPDQPAYDMYHPWGIGLARAQVPPPANPYVDTLRYADAMRGFALRMQSPKAWLAEGYWRGHGDRHIEPTGTPLYYALGSMLPSDYDTAHLALALAQFACTALAVLLLLRLRGVGAWPALCAAFVVELAYNPFVQDVKIGNVNSLQFLAIAALVYASASGALDRSRRLDLCYLPVLALLVAVKPNIAWVAAALGAHYAVHRGIAATVRGAALAALALALGVALGAWYFGSLGAWSDWLGYVAGQGGALLYSLDNGNQSVAMLMAEKGGAYGAYAYGLILAAALGLAILVALTQSGQRPDLLVPGATRVLRDPWLAASLGVVMTCISAPLVWPHYFLLNLLPIGWLALRGRFATACSALSFLTQSKPLIAALGLFHATGVISSMMAFTWAPLVPALLLHIVEARKAAGAMPRSARPASSPA